LVAIYRQGGIYPSSTSTKPVEEGIFTRSDGWYHNSRKYKLLTS
jgi:hypothetical protein